MTTASNPKSNVLLIKPEGTSGTDSLPQGTKVLVDYLQATEKSRPFAVEVLATTDDQLPNTLS